MLKVDSRRFRGQGALIDFDAIFRPLADENGVVRFPNIPDPSRSPTARLTLDSNSDAPGIDLKDFGNRSVAVFLRWQLDPALGLPSEPFRVWRRAALPLGENETITLFDVEVPPLGRLYLLSAPCVAVEARLTSGGAPANVTFTALANGVSFDSVVGVETVAAPAGGSRSTTLFGSHITAILVAGGNGHSISLTGVTQEKAAALGDWQLVETVGLPVDPNVFGDLPGQAHGKEQGIVGAEVPAVDAAVQRFARGLNPVGWYREFPGGQTAPTWQMPQASDMIADADGALLQSIHDALKLPPEKQAEFLTSHLIHPPENPNGERMPAEDGKADVSPVKLLQMAVATDPMQAVILGFGTGYPYEDIPTANFADRSFFGDPNRSDWDYMVTATWAGGFDGDSAPEDFAVVIPRPHKVVRPPLPADLQHYFLAHQRPAAPDGNWVASSRLSWERLPLANLSPVASFALGRSETTNGGPATPLMEPRPQGEGHMPIGNNENTQDPEFPRQSATDQALQIPNSPGSIGATYGVANQNLFGIWSPWAAASFSTQQPPPDPVNIVSATLRPFDTGTGTVCPADLVVEFVVDWRIRSVSRIEFRGRLYNAPNRHEEPPLPAPAGLQKSVGGAAQNIFVGFAGDTPSLTDPSVPLVAREENVVCLNSQGNAEVAPGLATQGHARRYRVTIPGFSLNYAATPHIGLALEARVREVIAPGRVGSFTDPAKLTYASDPRARPTQVIDIVRLASLPDAKGESHAVVSWNQVPSAAGYILYQTTETRMLESRGLAAAEPGDTLSQRLTRLKTEFRNNPNRRDFTRQNRDLLEDTELDVAIPRGSQDIQLYVVIPQSAGGVEGPWPSGPTADDALIPFVAPKIDVPAPPTIEAVRVEAAGQQKARIEIGTRDQKGAKPGRIDIYRSRVSDAARQLDSMGPPIASLNGSTGIWQVLTKDQPPVGSPVDFNVIVQGDDTPTGSWKPYWYRAVAWSEDLPQRGVLGGRGRASPAVAVLVPPNGPPPLNPVSFSWPGGAAADILASFSAPVPVFPTQAGPHLLAAEVTLEGEVNPAHFTTVGPGAADDPRNPGRKLPGALPLELISEVPATGKTGLWRVDDGFERNYRVLIKRPGTMPKGTITLRLTDPLGRVSEQTASFDAGSILPLPNLTEVSAFSIAGRGQFLSVTTDAPITGPLEYAVNVEIRLPRSGTGFGSDRFTGLTLDRDILGERGFFIPRRGPMLDLGTGRTSSVFTRDGDVLRYSGPLAEVPTGRGFVTSPAPQFDIQRQQVGGQTTLTVIAREDIRSISFEILVPDGRVVEQEWSS